MPGASQCTPGRVDAKPCSKEFKPPKLRIYIYTYFDELFVLDIEVFSDIWVDV